MNVSQLIDYLRQFDPTLRVIVKGYEGGFDDLTAVKTQAILVDVNKVSRPWGGRNKTWLGHEMEAPADYGNGAHAATDDCFTPESVRTLSMCEKAVCIF